jgi:hypothetical protein
VGTWTASQLLLLAQGLVFVLLLIVAVVYSLRLGSTKAWKDLAEQRKGMIDDRDGEIERLKCRLSEIRGDLADAARDTKRADSRSNEATQANLELQGKVRAYEREFGPLSKGFDR